MSADVVGEALEDADVVERPTSVEQAAELLRDTEGTVLFRGAGTALGWAGRVAPTDLTVDTRDLTGVLDHTAADMTAAVRAGTPLGELQSVVGEHGQWLALDPPAGADGATVGGLLAAGDSGPSRLRYGNLRDLVIGVTLVLPDGTVARSGGHVIKNVAGYDLAKLVHGSMGSLALVAEVVLRLHPRPVASVTTSGPADAAQAAEAAARLTASQLEPTAVEWFTSADGADGRLVVRSDGSPAAVAAAAEQVEALLREAGVPAASSPPADGPGLWDEAARAVLGAPEQTVLRVSTLPSDLLETAEHARRAGEAAGVRVGLASSAALGVHTVRLAGPDPQAVVAVLEQVRRHAVGRGGSVLVRDRSTEVDGLVDALGPPPPAVALLRRVRDQFDPTGRCAPGRFAPWY